MSTLTAYRVPPQLEFKAARELRDAGIRAYVPRDTTSKRKAPVARGYVFARHKPAFAKHVANPIGPVTSQELARLYLERQRRRSEERNPYSIGQAVYRGEIPAKVIGISGRTCIIEVMMLGKPHPQAIHYTQLRPG